MLWSRFLGFNVPLEFMEATCKSGRSRRGNLGSEKAFAPPPH